MNTQLTAEQFNTLLHQIDAATDVQLHEELRAAYERIAELEKALRQIYEMDGSVTRRGMVAFQIARAALANEVVS